MILDSGILFLGATL